MNAGSFFEIHFASFGLGMVGAENFQPLRIVILKKLMENKQHFSSLFRFLLLNLPTRDIEFLTEFISVKTLTINEYI